MRPTHTRPSSPRCMRRSDQDALGLLDVWMGTYRWVTRAVVPLSLDGIEPSAFLRHLIDKHSSKRKRIPCNKLSIYGRPLHQPTVSAPQTVLIESRPCTRRHYVKPDVTNIVRRQPSSEPTYARTIKCSLRVSPTHILPAPYCYNGYWKC